MSKKNIWIMSAKGESGDDYPACEVWTHKPTQKEIDTIRVALESERFNSEYHGEYMDNDDSFVTLNKIKYFTYITNYSIQVREIDI